MTKINIIIPVSDYEIAEKYYLDAMSFAYRERLFFLPVGSCDIALKLTFVDDEAKSHCPPQKRFPIFSYKLEKNFLSYCKRIHANGALIETAFSHPGGYYASVYDPDGNQFEIMCENFEEDDTSINFSTMAFFFSF